MSSVLDSLTGLMTAVVIPIVAIIGGISFAAYSLYLKVRRQREMLQLHHAERMAAIEKGIELPPLAPELLHDQDSGGYGAGRGRYRGLTLLLVGGAVTLALRQSPGVSAQWWWGLVIVAAGLGRLLTGYLERGNAYPNPGGASSLPGGNRDARRPGHG